MSSAYSNDDIYLNEDKIICTPSYNDIIDPKGIGHALFKSMHKYYHRVAQINAATGEQDTYGCLLSRSVRTALEMRERGVALNDVISICTLNNMDSCVPYIAAMFLGAIVVSFHPKQSSKDVASLLEETKPKIFFVEPESVVLAKKAQAESGVAVDIVVFGNSDEHTSFFRFLEPKLDEKEFHPVDLECDKQVASIYFTSGTTEDPKGVCITHAAFLNRITALSFDSFTSVLLSYSQLVWITSIHVLITTILKGCARLIDKQLDPAKIWDHIYEYKVTFLFLHPGGLMDFYESSHKSDTAKKCSNLEVIIVSGGMVPMKIIEYVRRILPKVMITTVLGQTETVTLSLGFDLSLPKERKLCEVKLNSCGRPVRGILYKVVDIDTEQAVGFNKTGELRLKNIHFPKNYLKNIASLYDDNGWLKTGDLVYFDEDFCFYYVERIRDILKYRGLKISPPAIEQVLCTHPAVKSAVVFGVPHHYDGDHAMACVVLNEDSKSVSERQILEYVNQRVDDIMQLRAGVKFVSNFPLTSTGKINKRALLHAVISENVQTNETS